jgi:glucarate dehydratase
VSLPTIPKVSSYALRQMKITAIRATPVNIPYHNPARMSAGTSGHSTRTIIEVETDAGLTGLGDASYAFAADVIEREFAPALLGLDPVAGGELRRYCLPDHLDFGTPLLKARLAAWGGMDIALWDLRGKAEGLPLYELLGGIVRKRAPFVSYSYSPPEAERASEWMSATARSAIDLTGARIFEFKVGVHPLAVDIETIAAVHAALAGRAEVAVDANMALSYEAARTLLLEVGALLENFEEPVESLRQMEDLAVEFGVHTSAHCTDLDTLMAYPHVDAVPTLDACGGITGVRRLAQTLGAIGRRVWVRSHAESGIGWAAIVHLGMTTPELHRPAQSLMDLSAEDLVLGDRWDVRQGGVRAPAAPGLGVALDRAALEACHELHRKYGEVQAFAPPLKRAATIATDR